MIVKTKLIPITYKIEHKCPKCIVGMLEHIPYPSGYLGTNKLHRHKCNNCGYKIRLEEEYPRMETIYEVNNIHRTSMQDNAIKLGLNWEE